MNGKEFKCEFGSKELAKIAYYYGLIDHVEDGQKIVCPFHEDVNPSMTLDYEHGRFYCFGCGALGDAFAFVKKLYPQLNDLQVCRKYVQVLHSDKVERIVQKPRARPKKESEDLYDEAHDYYYGLSRIDWELDEGEEIDRVRRYMRERGFRPFILTKCKAKVTYERNYPVVFPMFDNGRFKGWVSRTDVPEVEARRKYLYNTGFVRSNTLVGRYGKKPYVFVVEGYLDRLKMIQHLYMLGIADDVVAILGWKASQEHIYKLKQAGVKTVISALDNDECGQRGTEWLAKHFNMVRFAYEDGIKDIGETTLQEFKRMYDKTIKIYREKER